MRTLLIATLLVAGIVLAADRDLISSGAPPVNGVAITPSSVTDNYEQVGVLDAGVVAFGAGVQFSFSGGNLTSHGLSYVQGDTGQLIESLGTAVNSFYAPNGGFYSAVASGSNALSVATNGARVDFGAGASDYASSDGTTVTFAGPLSGTGAVTASTVLQGQAGTSGTNYPALTTLKVDATVNGSGADTTEDDLTKFTVLANSLSANGKGLHATFWGDNNGISTTDVMTIRCYYGHASTLHSGTLLVSRVLTASQANTWNVEVDIIRTGSATEVASATLQQGGTATATVQTNSSPAGDTTGATLIGCTGQRATSSVASSLRQLGLIVQELN